MKNTKEIITTIEGSIAKLDRLREKLQTQLAKSEAEEINNLPRGTWVIEDNRYFQIDSLIGDPTKTIVNLTRLGKQFSYSFYTFKKVFRLATPAEVEQHLRYLCISGGAHILTPRRDNQKQKFDPMKCDFYMVTCRGIQGAKVRHTSYAVAEQEAIRIAEKQNHETWIVGVVASVKPTQQVTHEVKKRF